MSVEPNRDHRPWSQARAAPVLTVVCLVALCLPADLFAQEPAALPALNKYCPVMTEEEIDPGVTTTYKGRTIAFCCDNCLAKFKANPERYFAGLTALDAEEGAAGATGNHDHDRSGQQPEREDERPPLLARVHPIIVHFPVAGVPLALLGWLAGRVSRKQVFAAADVPPLAVAALAAIAAVITGNIAHDSMRFGPSLHDFVHWHQYAGTTIMILLLGLSGLRIWRWNRLRGGWSWLYGGGLLVSSLLSGVVGYLGGSLVFGPDHLAW